MRVYGAGVAIAALCCAIGCGRTSEPPGSDDEGSGGSGAGTAGQGFGNQASSGGVATAGRNSGTSGAGGKAGGPSLPPDGDVPAAVRLTKLDLLLMVDNSRNTLEKQRLLTDGVKWLLSEVSLLSTDVHVGVITSSLGAHGASGAKDVCVSVEDDDHAHLLASVRPSLPTSNAAGFLGWGPDTDANVEAVLGKLEPTMAAVGDKGCGYEASLEAWYRFLVQPDPPQSVVVPANGSIAELQGIDQTILAQRKAFLREDSVLALVMLSDENDCSIKDEGYGWLISRAAPMYRATSACAQNPNDKCCQSCGEVAPSAGCPAISSDVSCQKGQYLTGSDEDDLNLRCWEQKRRFGFDMLHPISRYTDGLTRQFAFDRDDQPQRNPIFAGNGVRRHPSQVIVTGIVGVPWQDLADAASLSGEGLRLLSGAQLEAEGRWDVMLGDPSVSPPVPPTDPFMIETPIERSGVHPLDPSIQVVSSSSTNPTANVVNGHESVNIGNRLLQAACTFPIATPRVCDNAAADAEMSCQCYEEDAPYNHAVCQPPGGGPAGITQYRELATPGLRHLQLLRSLGDNAITASICPKVLEPTDPYYGYRPAMRALAARLETALQP